MKLRALRLIVAIGVFAGLCASGVSAQQSGKKEYTFRGKIEKVDGWMAAMSMMYKVDKSGVLDKVKVGDQITAKVYDGDFDTLYDVKVVPPPDKKSGK